MDDQMLRRINLIEVLIEELIACGLPTPNIPEDAAEMWTEDEIEALFQGYGKRGSAAGGTGNFCSKDSQSSSNPYAPRYPLKAHDQAPLNAAIQAPSQEKTDVPDDKRLVHDFDPPSLEQESLWFPALKRTGCPSDTPLRLRVICFHSAGNAEDMFSSEGTGARRAPSPLLDWCRTFGAEVLAVQLPGRGNRSKESPCDSARQAAFLALNMLASRLGSGHSTSQSDAGDDRQVPYVVVSHSMGCWVAYETLRMAMRSGLPMPIAWFPSAMPAPDIDEKHRPWRRQSTLNEGQFKEECRGWGISEEVFTPSMWPIYQLLLRSDFRIFDEYDWELGRDITDVSIPTGSALKEMTTEPIPGESKLLPTTFHFPIHSYFGKKDQRISQSMVQEWHRFTEGPFTCTAIHGNHLWPLQRAPKQQWLSDIVAKLQCLMSTKDSY
ncbi:hypothetical protein CEUSTIGMA_g8020.t1 [Chlamydomonas eustigma]|uniref:AB hydrolase-1 domain-containing protein n=1 Tax=Chlamydomonas eustigma TaxID=1157962 RepID=A0A250XBX5_9CHLO|nr:hypothetical protein CEUSTIGMA_g8020.t1 [Chlamydomonas eustigma]|eukprot:GAX80583.1 hypothetical protein CEUSTIGMA_g8020.t1 [Chlamydomonas eustigma]